MTISEPTEPETEVEGGEKAPGREAASLADANVAVPANAAVVAGVLAGPPGEDPNVPRERDDSPT
jgi:hypothetical protein